MAAIPIDYSLPIQYEGKIQTRKIQFYAFTTGIAELDKVFMLDSFISRSDKLNLRFGYYIWNNELSIRYNFHQYYSLFSKENNLDCGFMILPSHYDAKLFDSTKFKFRIYFAITANGIIARNVLPSIRIQNCISEDMLPMNRHFPFSHNTVSEIIEYITKTEKREEYLYEDNLARIIIEKSYEQVRVEVFYKKFPQELLRRFGRYYYGPNLAPGTNNQPLFIGYTYAENLEELAAKIRDRIHNLKIITKGLLVYGIKDYSIHDEIIVIIKGVKYIFGSSVVIEFIRRYIITGEADSYHSEFRIFLAKLGLDYESLSGMALLQKN